MHRVVEAVRAFVAARAFFPGRNIAIPQRRQEHLLVHFNGGEERKTVASRPGLGHWISVVRDLTNPERPSKMATFGAVRNVAQENFSFVLPSPLLGGAKKMTVKNSFSPLSVQTIASPSVKTQPKSFMSKPVMQTLGSKQGILSMGQIKSANDMKLLLSGGTKGPASGVVRHGSEGTKSTIAVPQGETTVPSAEGDNISNVNWEKPSGGVAGALWRFFSNLGTKTARSSN